MDVLKLFYLQLHGHCTCSIAGTSPVTYTGLSKGMHRINIQAACPGQSFQDGSRKRIRFEILYLCENQNKSGELNKNIQ